MDVLLCCFAVFSLEAQRFCLLVIGHGIWSFHKTHVLGTKKFILSCASCDFVRAPGANSAPVARLFAVSYE